MGAARATDVGIWGLGQYVPPEVRGNEWWPPATVAGWRASRPSGPPPITPASPGAARILKALATHAPDPFQGVTARHVLPEAMSVADMQERAARDAITRAGIDPTLIDVVLTHTVVPDELLASPACRLHHELGLSRSCLALEVDAAQYSFIAQLSLAASLIRSGQAACALLVQACCASRLVDPSDPVSAVCGDGASAVVIGPVRSGYGLLGAAHRVDGEFGKSLIMSVRGQRWYDPGRPVIHVGDPSQMQALLLQTADLCKESVDAALADAHLAPSDVGFLGVHQGTPWLRQVVQDHLEMSHARSVDTFSRLGYLFSATLPISLAFAEQEGLLAEHDVVAITGGGTGMVFGAAVLRWGGR